MEKGAALRPLLHQPHTQSSIPQAFDGVAADLFNRCAISYPFTSHAQLLSEAGLSVTVGFAMPAELPPESRTSHFGAWWLLWACFILLVVYPLSTGPVVLCIDRAGVNDDLIEIIYFPLIALCEACDPVAEFFQWYVGDVWGAP